MNQEAIEKNRPIWIKNLGQFVNGSVPKISPKGIKKPAKHPRKIISANALAKHYGLCQSTVRNKAKGYKLWLKSDLISFIALLESLYHNPLRSARFRDYKPVEKQAEIKETTP